MSPVASLPSSHKFPCPWDWLRLQTPTSFTSTPSRVQSISRCYWLHTPHPCQTDPLPSPKATPWVFSLQPPEFSLTILSSPKENLGVFLESERGLPHSHSHPGSLCWKHFPSLCPPRFYTGSHLRDHVPAVPSGCHAPPSGSHLSRVAA